jgi:hypothetical protein
MVRSHDHGGAVGDHGLYVTLQRTTCRTVNTRERLVQEKKIRMSHPGAGE